MRRFAPSLVSHSRTQIPVSGKVFKNLMSTQASFDKRPKRVRIVEVGARDGLQNESVILDSAVKVELIERLASSGLKSIEAGSFVSPKWVPQMANTGEVLKALNSSPNKLPDVQYSVLVPNMKGFESALAAGATEILVFTAAGEAFTQRNINCSISESIQRFSPVIAAAHKNNIRVRGCVSTIFDDPYDGPVSPSKVAEIARTLYDLGCYEVMLGDTTGVGTVGSTEALLKEITQLMPVDKIALHFHDTYGQALANVLVALEYGVSSFDSGVAGYGGCPYAKGATGNLATEDLVYMLHGMGIETGVNLQSVIETGIWLSPYLKKLPVSSITRARLSQLSQPAQAEAEM